MLLDAQQCVQQGLIGALGSIPGTVCAHPLDLTKIRLQVTSLAARRSPAILSLGDAIRHTAQAPFRGLSAGVQQKVCTRGPMFLCSEMATQSCQKYTGLPRETAVIVGSFSSGYVTGFVASLSEWAKVQRGMRIMPMSSPAHAPPLTVWTLVRTASQEPLLLRSLGRRMRGAAWRNAIFDGTFFGVEHALRERYDSDQQQPVRWAVAAAVALCLDYPVDVVVKRSMAIPATEPVPHGPLRATFDGMWREGFQIYRGLTVKVLEFGVSYSVTGAMAPLIVKSFLAVTAAMAVSTSY